MYPALILLFTFLATCQCGENAARKVDRRKAEDADLRSQDKRRSMQRDGRAISVHRKRLQVGKNSGRFFRDLTEYVDVKRMKSSNC